MKRILTWMLLLVLVVGLFAGCKDSKDAPKATEPTAATEEYVSAQAAMEYLKAIYKRSEEALATPRDYERYAVIRVGGEPFNVEWSVNVGEDLVKIVPGEGENVVIDINEQCQEPTPYELTASITDQGGNTVTFTWNYTVPKAIDVAEVLKEAYALADGESLPYEVTLTGKIINIGEMYNPEYKNITVTMEIEGFKEYPITCYRLKGEGCDELNFGYIITVTGTIKNHKGTIEFDFGCILEDYQKGDAIDAPSDPLEIVKQAYALKDGAILPYIATLTGKVVDIETPFDPDYNNISIAFEVEGAAGKPITCYRLKGTGVDQIAIDDIVTVKGVIKNYKGKIEFDSGCQLLDRISGGREAEKPSSDPKKIMADAAKLKPGQHLNYYATLTGKVTDIDSPYDKEYSNISVIIKIDGYSRTIICYRMKGEGVEKVCRGDTITVKGIIENYKGKLEFGSGCTMLDRVSGGGKAQPETSNVKTIMRAAARLASGNHLDFYSTLTGKVIEIESPYDKEYGNITVIMTVKGYENMPITCYRLKSDAANCAKIAVGDTITVRGVMENYKGKLEYGSGCTLKGRKSGGGVAKPESSNAKTILTDAYKLAEGQKLSYYANLTGKVIEIDSPYDKEYGNISVIMQVEDPTTGGTVNLLCYRLKSGGYNVSKIAVGDTIKVRGVIENYKGSIQFGTGCMLKYRKSGGGVAKPESSNAKTILTDAHALADGQKLEYYANLTGLVTAIDSPYDKEYENISVYIQVEDPTTEGKLDMLCYRLKSGGYSVSKIAVGDTVKVRGVIENYKGALQFGTGSTLTYRKSGGGVAKPESSNFETIWADAQLLAPGQKLDYFANLTGKIVQVKEAYTSAYENTSVYIELEGNGQRLLAYRMKSGKADASKLRIGDTITVRGVLTNYNGEIQFAQGCTLAKVVPGYNPGDNMTAEEILTAAYALESASSPEDKQYLEGQYTLTGEIISVDSAYSSQYKNITVTMQVEGCEDKPIQAYRLVSGAADASVLKVGDTITVSGQITKYNNRVQFDQGCALDACVPGEGGPGGIEIPEGSPKISFADEANRIVMTNDQQVWQQNGITVTNDKAGSTTAVNAAVNPARFYKNSKLTVEYPAMTRLVFTHSAPVGTTEYVNGLTQALESRDDVVVTIVGYTVQVDLKEATDIFVVESLAYQIRLYDITVCTGTTPPENGGNTGGTTDGFEPVVLEEGKAYNMQMFQGELGKNLYLAGGLNEKGYWLTTEDPKAAKEVFAEKSGDGYHFYYVDGEVKTYIEVQMNSENKPRPLASKTASQVWIYDTEAGVFTVTIGNTKYYMGTYSTYDTISVSSTWYITGANAGNRGTAQFYVEFIDAGTGGSNPGGGEGTTPDVPATAEYAQVTSLDEIKAGGKFVIAVVYNGEYKVLNTSFDQKPAAVAGGAGELNAANLPLWTFAPAGNGVSLASGGSFLARHASTKDSLASSATAVEWGIRAGSAEGNFQLYIPGDETYTISYQYSNRDDLATVRNRFGAFANTTTTGAYVFDLCIFKVVG